jgi:hypothetical protein
MSGSAAAAVNIASANRRRKIDTTEPFIMVLFIVTNEGLGKVLQRTWQ